jgi:outer membrane protein assembly factor BamA
MRLIIRAPRSPANALNKPGTRLASIFRVTPQGSPTRKKIAFRFNAECARLAQMRAPLGPSFLFAFCSLVLSLPSRSQTFKLPDVSFAGVPAYSQADLLKVTGLKPGSISTQAQLQTAAQNLSDTGLFADIHFESNAKGLVFTLKPMPADNLPPARFTNFVWWSSEQLDSMLKARIPLYIGNVPLAGNLQDTILSTLKTLLLEKGLTASIVAVPVMDLGATKAISFSIDSPPVRIHSLTVAQASPAMQPKLDKAVKTQVGQLFDQDTTLATITDLLTRIYRNDGYLDMSVSDLTHSSPQITPTDVDLDLTVTPGEGEPYRLSQLLWPGSDVMTTADFNKQVKLKPEEIASEFALRQSLAPLANAYFAKGFQDAKIQAPATIDRATHHVGYTIRVVPGDQYHLHSVKAVGLSDRQQKEFNSGWRMNPGDAYDVNYVTSFLNKNTALQSFNGYSATYKAYSDPNTHLVDLVLTFVKGGTLINVN